MTPAEAIMNTVEWKPIESDSALPVRDDLPYATHSGVLNIFGLDLKCYRLSDGRAVFDADDINRFFGGLSS